MSDSTQDGLVAVAVVFYVFCTLGCAVWAGCLIVQPGHLWILPATVALVLVSVVAFLLGKYS